MYYDEIFDKVLDLLNLKGSKLGQILRADKTGFHTLGNISDSYLFVADLSMYVLRP